MKTARRRVRAIVLAVCLAGPAVARAEAEELGLNLDLGFASAYNWRGLNALGERQGDQHGYLAPGITWTVVPGLTLGYWGAFQVTGENASALVDGGVGAETDLSVSYEREVAAATAVSFGLGAYAYPFADEAAAGAATPLYLEPSASIAWSGPVELGLAVSYLAAVQDALADNRYLYLRPTVEKSFELAAWAGLELALGVGYKALADDYVAASHGNRVDVALSVAVPIQVGAGAYVTPAVEGAWTDLDRAAVGAATFADEAFVFGSLHVGTDL